MVDPAVALFVFAITVAVAGLLFWPRWGLVVRLGRMSELTERVLLEDALKHVYTCESIGRVCSTESVAGQLEVTTGKAAALLLRLAESKLTRSDDSGPIPLLGASDSMDSFRLDVMARTPFGRANVTKSPGRTPRSP